MTENTSATGDGLSLSVFHETVISTMAEGVVVQSSSGEIRLANPAALSILGLTLDQIKGKTSVDPDWHSLREDGSPFPGDEHPAMVALRTGQSVNDVVMGVARPDGSRRWIKINARPVFKNGLECPSEVVVTFADITAERNALSTLRAQRQKLELALDVGSIAVSVYDSKAGDFRRFGHAETLKTFEPAGKMGQDPFIERVPVERRAALRERWEQHLAGGPRLKFETPVILADGSLRWALAGVEKLVDEQGGFSGALVALKDIEERKRAEFALIDSLKQLENALRAKDVFLANIGHEIRTPLNGVVGMASALALTDLTDEQRDMVSLIASSGEVVDRLLSDLLDMSKLDAGRVTLENANFDLCAAVAEAAQLFQIRASDKGLRFTMHLANEAQGIWTGDKIRIKQVVSNLVSNAIKFTMQGDIHVRLSATGGAGTPGLDWVSIEVEDTGIGLAEDEQSRVFERFEQANPGASQPQGGTGLGLTICKSLVLLMGGEISVVSQSGLGSTFTVRVPLQRAAPPAANGDIKGTSGMLRILLVDDHPTNLRVVEAMLRAFDCDVVSARNGEEALTQFQSGEFGLILMDMSMPVMDGLGATRAIRALECEAKSRRTPIAMLTAYGSDQHRREAHEAGADFHIVKPVTPVTLLAGLEKAMRAAKSADAA